jgi:uncharacterized protein (TIGR00290 family)
MPEPILFCWSGGKDSAMALHALRQGSEFRVDALLTTVTETYDRISMHGVRGELLEKQCAAISLPLHEVRIPPHCVNPIYEARMEEALRVHYQAGIRKVAFGDIFLEDLRAYREKNLAHMGMTALFPIWKHDTGQLIRSFHAAGFRAIAVCIDPRVLDRSFAGRELDEQFFRDLPPNVDPCGENGEFHTFVFDGPIFNRPIGVRTGEVVERDSFIYCDLLPQETVVGARFSAPVNNLKGPEMNSESHAESPVLRTLLILALVVLAAVLRIAPHPWNFTPVGAMAIFSGAVIRDRRLAFLIPVLAMAAGDIWVGFNKLTPLVYASFLLSVAIGRLLCEKRSVWRIGGATFAGSMQFFLVTNLGVWAFLGSYPHTARGLLGCYIAGIPFFWSTVASDGLYAALLFGSFALVEHFVPAVQETQA